MSEDGKVEFWWDRSVETTQKFEHNHPDITVLYRVAQRWTFVDFSVPMDKNVSKEDEKISNYSPLIKEITKLHRVSAKVVPLVVGCLSVVSSGPKLSGGGGMGGDTPPISRKLTSSGKQQQIVGPISANKKKLTPNHLITKCNTVLFVGQYKGHALFVRHCSYIPPKSRTQVLALCVMPIGAVFKGVGHSGCVGWNADICSCWDNSDLTKDTWTLTPRSGVEPSCSYT